MTNNNYDKFHSARYYNMAKLYDRGWELKKIALYLTPIFKNNYTGGLYPHDLVFKQEKWLNDNNINYKRKV